MQGIYTYIPIIIIIITIINNIFGSDGSHEETVLQRVVALDIEVKTVLPIANRPFALWFYLQVETKK
jgi:hypothetical protein